MVLSEKNIRERICSLLKELKENTGATNEDIDELIKIMDIADFILDES